MAKVFTTANKVLTTSESDIYTANQKALTLLVQAVNIGDVPVTAEIWMTNNSNVRVTCLFPLQDIAAKEGVTDNVKHVIPIGYKLRGTASAGSAVYVEVSTMEGV